MRANPKLDIEKAITELGVGEALVSLARREGHARASSSARSSCRRQSQIGPITPEERKAADRRARWSPAHYEKAVDRESAYEKLKGADRVAAGRGAAGQGRREGRARRRAAAARARAACSSDILFGSTGPRGGRREGWSRPRRKSAARDRLGVGREIVRGVLGSILGGGKRR